MSLARSSSRSGPLRGAFNPTLIFLIALLGCAPTADRPAPDPAGAYAVHDDRPTVSHDLFAASVRTGR